MKSLIAAALLLALTFPAHAAPKGEWSLIFDAWTCSWKGCDDDGRYIPHTWPETFATERACLAEGRRVVKLERRIRGRDELPDTRDVDRIEKIHAEHSKATDAIEIGGMHPRCEQSPAYLKGVRDYREGLCYHARPYPPGADHDLWERGYYAQQKKEHNKRDWSHCHGVKE